MSESLETLRLAGESSQEVKDYRRLWAKSERLAAEAVREFMASQKSWATAQEVVTAADEQIAEWRDAAETVLPPPSASAVSGGVSAGVGAAIEAGEDPWPWLQSLVEGHLYSTAIRELDKAVASHRRRVWDSANRTPSKWHRYE